MAKSKSQQNAIKLDPNREKISMQMATVPGSPENTQMNNPMNVTALGNQSSSMTGINEYPYGDKGVQNSPQLGTNILNPAGRPPSGLQQSFPVAGRGKNRVPYGMQQQPDSSGNSPVWDQMETQRLAQPLANAGLPTSAMGLGSAAMTPGQMPGDLQGSNGPMLMQGQQSIVPGSAPQKINKKGKRTA